MICLRTYRIRWNHLLSFHWKTRLTAQLQDLRWNNPHPFPNLTVCSPPPSCYPFSLQQNFQKSVAYSYWVTVPTSMPLVLSSSSLRMASLLNITEVTLDKSTVTSVLLDPSAILSLRLLDLNHIPNSCPVFPLTPSSLGLCDTTPSPFNLFTSGCFFSFFSSGSSFSVWLFKVGGPQSCVLSSRSSPVLSKYVHLHP